MDYIWGRDLRQILSAGQKISYPAIEKSFQTLLAGDSDISRQIRSAVDALLSAGVIHRDLHPANFVLATGSKRLYVIDFQVADIRPRHAGGSTIPKSNRSPKSQNLVPGPG